MNESRNRRWDLWIGLGGTLAVNLILFLTFSPLSLFIWILEWIYVVPAAMVFQSRRRVRLAQGIWIMAGVSVLLNFFFCGYGASRI